jgi:hypothetical protein
MCLCGLHIAASESLLLLIPVNRILAGSPVAHVCNFSYSGGRDQEDRCLKPAQVNSSVRPYLKKPFSKIGLVEWIKVKAMSSSPSTTNKQMNKQTKNQRENRMLFSKILSHLDSYLFS